MGLFKLLKTIQQRPGMFLGAPSVSSLQMFLGGYFFARHEQGLAITEEEQIFERFQGWAEQRFQVKASVSWAKIILLYSADERAGFELFFELWEEFVREVLREGKAPRAQLTEKNHVESIDKGRMKEFLEQGRHSRRRQGLPLGQNWDEEIGDFSRSPGTKDEIPSGID